MDNELLIALLGLAAVLLGVAIVVVHQTARLVCAAGGIALGAIATLVVALR